jgi:hypothetical protein
MNVGRGLRSRAATFAKLATLALLLSACAGPSTPFGPISFQKWLAGAWSWVLSWSPEDEEKAFAVKFTPDYQRFHRSGPLAIEVAPLNDQSLTPRVDVFYNDIDVTSRFQVTNSKSDDGPRRTVLKFDDLRLPPSRFHKLEVRIRPSLFSPVVQVETLQRPRCQIDAAPTNSGPTPSNQKLTNTEGFRVPASLVTNLEAAATKSEINPAFLAGLIAQESSFNPRAVSWNRALGLTQMTNIAEQDILRHVEKWPRFDGIEDLTFPQLKLKVWTKRINERNEWRLHPELSLKGGAHFLNRVERYWQKPEKQKLLVQSGSSMEDLVLASYNVGPAAVSQAIEDRGPHWLQDPEVGTPATKYMQLVQSYCLAFSAADAAGPRSAEGAQ